MTLFRAVLLASVLPVAIAQAQSIGFSTSDNSSGTTHETITVVVFDDQTQASIPDAKVTITDSFGTERQKVDSRGTVTFFNLSALPKTVTVSRSGYATLSVVGVQTDLMSAYLKPLVDSQASGASVVASGTITNWDGASSGDTSLAHGGLVFQTVSATDLVHFQMGNFISPLKDTLDLGGLAGSHQIPSNIVIPDQTVNYFIDVELNKPLYRLPIPAQTSLGLTGVEVEASVSDIVSASQNHGTFDYDLLNKIQFKRVGMTQNFSAQADTQMDVDAKFALSAQHDVSLSKAPPFQADVIAAALYDVNGDKQMLVPTDLKTVLNSQNPSDTRTVSLVGPDSISTANRAVATIAVGEKGKMISGILFPSAGKTIQAGDFLNTDSLAQDQALPDSVTVHTPAQGMGAAIFETNQPVWYVYTLPAAGDVQIPTAKISQALTIQSYSVNQIEFSAFNEKAIDGTQVMSHLQRFARSSAKIK
jgi:hypothetical protein